MHEAWSDLKIMVDHAIAKGDWVAGRSKSPYQMQKAAIFCSIRRARPSCFMK
jgi:hypothetical protein